MKPLYSAIAVSVIVASLTVPALQARADDEVRSGAWNEGRAAGRQCAAAGSNCKFDNPYNHVDSAKSDDSSKTSDAPDSETQALNNSDYIAGFIVGKSEATK